MNGLSCDDKAEKPTELWYLMPFFFGIIGGIVGYVSIKKDDRAMADNLLYFGIIWTLIVILVGIAVYWYFLSMQIPSGHSSLIQALGKLLIPLTVL